MLIGLFVYINYSLTRSMFWRIHMDWINQRELYHTYIQYNKTGWIHFFQKNEKE